MTQTAGATCPTCAASLPAVGAPCARCSAPQPGAAAYPPPYQAAQYPPPPFPNGPSAGMAPYQPQAYGQPGPYPVARPVKSPAVAVLLTFVWIGAGHLYLERMGLGLALMAAHFFVGFLLFFIFFPLGFVAWLVAVIVCSVACSNLANQVNAGTAPPRATW